MKKNTVNLFLTSFGFKYPPIPTSDLLFDVRAIPDPWLNPLLRNASGKDETTQRFVFSQKEAAALWAEITTSINDAIEKALHENRTTVIAAIGCMGGQHRSVAFVERLKIINFACANIIVQHRDLDKKPSNPLA